MIDRRGLLVLSAAGAAAAAVGACSRTPSGPPAGPPGVDRLVEAAPTDIDLGGVTVRTWAYGGQIPGREIRIRKGQTLRAQVTNKLPADTTVHWHGGFVPNAMDGVPVLTQQPIAAGQGYRYEFVTPDAGTYWFHPHIGTQLDRGLYAALIVEDPNERTDYDDELVVMLDDWIDGIGTDPDEVLAGLKKAGMGAMGSMAADAGVSPTAPLGDDGGDVTYPYYVINGRVPRNPHVADYRAGQRIRLRIIAAGTDTAFRVAVPNTVLTITHTDGFPVIPKQTNSVILGPGERVDATITVGSSVPLIAAAEAKDGYAQLNLRVNGAPAPVDIDDFIKTLRAAPVLNTAQLVAAPQVQLAQRDPAKTLDLRIQGPIDGYNWPINGTLYDPVNNGLSVSTGERVRLRLINESKMFHPMHLHGHTFQVVQPGGPGPRKDSVLVPPLQTVEIDFDTSNPGKWIIHCHNDYHLATGLATFIYYA